MYALTEIKGVGRRYANIVCKKADVDLNKRCVGTLDRYPTFSYVPPRAGELNSDELERLVTIIQNPTQFKIPVWFLNRQRDIVDGKTSQILSNNVDSKLRDDLERLKKIRAHRGLLHFWGLRVRGQHTKTTGQSPCRQHGITLIRLIYRSSGKDGWCVEEAWLSILSVFVLGVMIYIHSIRNYCAVWYTTKCMRAGERVLAPNCCGNFWKMHSVRPEPVGLETQHDVFATAIP